MVTYGDLQQIDSQLFLQKKIGLFGNNKELQFGTYGLMVNLEQVWRNKGEARLRYGLRRGYCK